MAVTHILIDFDDKTVILDTQLLARVIEKPELYRGYTFICPASYFLQYPPYFNRYSTALWKIVASHKHFDLEIILLNYGAYKIRDKALMKFVESSRHIKIKSGYSIR